MHVGYNRIWYKINKINSVDARRYNQTSVVWVMWIISYSWLWRMGWRLLPSVRPTQWARWPFRWVHIWSVWAATGIPSASAPFPKEDGTRATVSAYRARLPLGRWLRPWHSPHTPRFPLGPSTMWRELSFPISAIRLFIIECPWPYRTLSAHLWCGCLYRQNIIQQVCLLSKQNENKLGIYLSMNADRA